MMILENILPAKEADLKKDFHCNEVS